MSSKGKGKGRGPAVAKGKKKGLTFVVDCSKPVSDKIMDIVSFEKFLLEKIKVNGKTGGCLGIDGCGHTGHQPTLCRQASHRTRMR